MLNNFCNGFAIVICDYQMATCEPKDSMYVLKRFIFNHFLDNVLALLEIIFLF